jgi:5-formyltetrahydrofolate cyclo-ligase
LIFDSLGIGEFGVVIALAIVLIEPKKLGKVMKEFGKFKRKVTQIQSEVKSQLDSITREEDARERVEQTSNDKAGMRKWGRDQVQALTASTRALATSALVDKIREWPTYTQANIISCFSGTLQEIDTEPLLRHILADGKTLLMPYIDATEPEKIMRMARITNLEVDLAEGTFGIREPRKEVQNIGIEPTPDLIFIPGTCFDERGGRLGQGQGFYDRYLAKIRAFRAGVGFDVQITQKNLALEAHDQFMDAVLSEKRLLIFSAPSQ